MKVRDGETYYTIGEAAQMVGRGAQTIKSWYDWADAENIKGLPEVHTDFDVRGARHFKSSDIPKLKMFRDNIKYGKMAQFNRKRWGERGRK